MPPLGMQPEFHRRMPQIGRLRRRVTPRSRRRRKDLAAPRQVMGAEPRPRPRSNRADGEYARHRWAQFGRYRFVRRSGSKKGSDLFLNLFGGERLPDVGGRTQPNRLTDLFFAALGG